MQGHLIRLVCDAPASGFPAMPAAGAGFPPDVLRIPFTPGQTLAQAVYLSGIFRPPALCSGIGRCGLCRVLLTEHNNFFPDPLPEEASVFSPDEIALGWRLGCLHAALADTFLRVPARRVAEDSLPFVATSNTSCFLAVDLGTTSLQWQLGHERDGSVEGGSEINPQMGAGSEIISRLAMAAAPEGRAVLRDLARASLIRIARRAAGAEPVMCLAANPAMTAIFLDRDVSGLTGAPYSLPVRGGGWERVPGLPPVWIPPQLAPFVGGDVSAGYAFLAENALLAEEGAKGEGRKVAFPFLLADLGTNGEFLLALSRHEALVTSVALGPALEGIGLLHGVTAGEGAITGFTLTPQGIEPRLFSGKTPGDKPGEPAGISGTGYLALLHVLRKAGAMAEEGMFTPERSTLLKKYFSRLGGAGNANIGAFLPLPAGMRLTAADVEAILKVKAAFSLGLALLLREAGLPSHALSAIYVAGALGEYTDKEALEALGFFPPGLGGRIAAVGNSSLAGAALLARSETLRAALVRWSAGVRAVDLASDAAFARHFAGHMRFSWAGAEASGRLL